MMITKPHNIKTNQNQLDNFKTRRNNNSNYHIRTISHTEQSQFNFDTYPSNYFPNKNPLQNYEAQTIHHNRNKFEKFSNEHYMTTNENENIPELIKQITNNRQYKEYQIVTTHVNEKTNIQRKDSINMQKKQIILRRQSNSNLGANKYTPLKYQQKEYIKTETKSTNLERKQINVKQFNNDIQKQLKILKHANERLDHSLTNSRNNYDFMTSRRIINSQVEKHSKVQQQRQNLQNLVIQKRSNNDGGWCIESDITIKTLKDLDNEKQKLNKQIKLKNKQLQKYLRRQNELITENMKANQNIQRLIEENTQLKSKLDQINLNNSRLYQLLKNKIQENQNISISFQNQLRKTTQLLRQKQEEVDLLKFQIQKLFESCNLETKSRTSITSILNDIQKRNQNFQEDSNKIQQASFQSSHVNESMINDMISKDIEIDKLKYQNEKLTKIINEGLLKVQNDNNELKINLLNNHYQNLVKQLCDKDMKIAELQITIKKYTQQQQL